MILPIASCVSENRFLALGEEYRLQTPGNKVPSRISGLNGTESNRIIKRITKEQLNHILITFLTFLSTLNYFAEPIAIYTAECCKILFR
jgi:hypothetical protein